MTDRPQAPGYLANLMARLFHEVADHGLHPLGIDAEQFPLLIELWFGERVTRDSLARSQESDQARIGRLLGAMQAQGLLQSVPSNPSEVIVLTDKANALREPAIAAARRANQVAASVLSESEMAQLLGLMNRVIDGLQGVAAR